MKTQCEVCRRATNREGAPLAIYLVSSSGPLQGRWTCLHCYLSRHAKAEINTTNTNQRDRRT